MCFVSIYMSPESEDCQSPNQYVPLFSHTMEGYLGYYTLSLQLKHITLLVNSQQQTEATLIVFIM